MKIIFNALQIILCLIINENAYNYTLFESPSMAPEFNKKSCRTVLSENRYKTLNLFNPVRIEFVPNY